MTSIRGFVAGALARSGKDSDARFIGTQAEIAVAWQATPEVIKLADVMANYRF